MNGEGIVAGESRFMLKVIVAIEPLWWRRYETWIRGRRDVGDRRPHSRVESGREDAVEKIAVEEGEEG